MPNHPALAALAFSTLAAVTLGGCGEAAADRGEPAAAAVAASATPYEPPARDAPEEAAPGAYAGLGNGVEIAVLSRLQSPPGADSSNDNTVAEAWLVRIRNAADAPRVYPLDLFALELGGEVRKQGNVFLFGGDSQHWFAQNRGVEVDRLSTIPGRLMPGQEVEGWFMVDTTSAEAGAEAALLVLRKVPFGEIQPGMISVRLPIAGGVEAEAGATASTPATLGPDEPLAGGALTWTPEKLASEVIEDRGETVRRIEVGLGWKNSLDREINFMSMGPNASSCTFVADDRGRLYSAYRNRFAGQAMKLAPGESTSTAAEFRVPADATGLRLIVDGQLGHKLRRDEKPIAEAAPMGSWAID